MTNKKIHELYGYGSNFYAGRNLGRSGADSNFSSYVSSKKFPKDYFENLSDDLDDDILDDREHSDEKGYHLEATLDNINEGLGEWLTDKTYGAIYTGLFKVLDLLTQERAGMIALFPAIATNLFQMHRSNKAYLKIKNNNPPDIEQLKKIERALARDFKDLMQAAAIAIPAVTKDAMLALAIEAGDFFAKDVAVMLHQASELVSSVPFLKWVWKYMPLIGGKSILFTAFKHIKEIKIIIKQNAPLSNQQSQQINSAPSSQTPNQPQTGPIRIGTSSNQRTSSDASSKAKGFLSDFFGFKLNESSLENLNLETFIEDEEYIEDENLDEFSAGGVGGVATPLGTDASGKKPSKSKEKKRKKDADIWNESIRYNQAWSHKTFGKIILK
jgi:hypothetical protein